MENYSDGLEFLIKSRICIAEEFELKNVNSDLRRAFKKLVDAAEEKQIGYYRRSDELESEIDELTDLLNLWIGNLQRRRVAPYFLYLAYRDILSICILCPYILSREKIYNVFRRGLKEQLY